MGREVTLPGPLFLPRFFQGDTVTDSRYRARRARRIVAALVLAPTMALAAGAPPDALYVNGRVFTGIGQGPSAQALAVHDGRILATGSDASVRALAGPGTRVVDLGGRFVMPAATTTFAAISGS